MVWASNQGNNGEPHRKPTENGMQTLILKRLIGSKSSVGSDNILKFRIVIVVARAHLPRLRVSAFLFRARGGD